MSETEAIHILIASRDKASMSAFKTELAENLVQTTWAESSSDAIAKIARTTFDLVVTDEDLGDMTGLELIKKVVAKKPMVNCAAVSSLLPAEFHEVSEGLGILMQLTVKPGQEEAKKLLVRLTNILNLAKQAGAER